MSGAVCGISRSAAARARAATSFRYSELGTRWNICSSAVAVTPDSQWTLVVRERQCRHSSEAQNRRMPPTLGSLSKASCWPARHLPAWPPARRRPAARTREPRQSARPRGMLSMRQCSSLIGLCSNSLAQACRAARSRALCRDSRPLFDCDREGQLPQRPQHCRVERSDSISALMLCVEECHGILDAFQRPAMCSQSRSKTLGPRACGTMAGV
jgi:hypothetical protein